MAAALLLEHLDARIQGRQRDRSLRVAGQLPLPLCRLDSTRHDRLGLGCPIAMLTMMVILCGTAQQRMDRLAACSSDEAVASACNLGCYRKKETANVADVELWCKRLSDSWSGPGASRALGDD